MHRVVLSEGLPACSRCGGPLITSVVMPHDDDAGQPIHLELCAGCDASKPAAGALLDWFATGGGYDFTRVEEGADLLMEWTAEGMAEHGWAWAVSPYPEESPSDRLLPRETAVGGPTVEETLTPYAVPGLQEITRLEESRDVLRARLESAPPGERERLKDGIRRLGATIAEALAAHDESAEALLAEAARPDPELRPDDDGRDR